MAASNDLNQKMNDLLRIIRSETKSHPAYNSNQYDVRSTAVGGTGGTANPKLQHMTRLEQAQKAEKIERAHRQAQMRNAAIMANKMKQQPQTNNSAFYKGQIPKRTTSQWSSED